MPDESTNRKALIRWLKNEFPSGFSLLLEPSMTCPQLPVPPKADTRVLLCGKNSGYADRFGKAEIILYLPDSSPNVAPDLDKIRGVYLQRWEESGRSRAWTERIPERIKWLQ